MVNKMTMRAMNSRSTLSRRSRIRDYIAIETTNLPINAEHDQHERRKNVSSSADHHQDLASHVARVPLRMDRLNEKFHPDQKNHR